MRGAGGKGKKGSKGFIKGKLRPIITEQDCIREFYKKI